MTIWELMKSRPYDDFTAYDKVVDDLVEVIGMDDYEPGKDNYYDFLFELYRRVEITEMPRYNMTDLTADFYGFIEKNIDLFHKHFILKDDDPAALMVEQLNEVCAGYVSDSLYGEIAKDLAKLPVPQERGAEAR